MAAPNAELPTGVVVGGRYAVEGVLGRGGMGTVYAATHLLTHRRVALKVVAWTDAAERDDRESRFLSEARNAVAVRHRHVVDVLDMGVHEGEPFLVMEYLEGESLDALLGRIGTVPPDQAIAILLPIMGALAALHERGIVHRDIKPSNIFLARSEEGAVLPKLLDFGLSRAVTDMRLTRAGVVLGTPLYMAPEHASGLGARAQSDVWALGVVLYECLAGALPYASTEPNVVATLVLAGHVRPLGEVAPQVPAALCQVLDCALSRDLDVRHADMRAFAAALVEAAVHAGVALPDDPEPVGLPEYRGWLREAGRAPPRSLLPYITQPFAPKGAPPARASTRVAWRGARLGLGLAVVAVALLGAAMVGWLATRTSSPASAADGAAVGQAPSGHVPSPGARRGVAEGPATGAEQVELPPPPSVQPLPGSVGPGAVPSALKPARAAGAAKSSAAERPAPKRAAPRRSSADAGKRGDWESQLETEWK